MSDFHLSNIFAILLCVLMMIVAPTYLFLQRQEVLTQNYVDYETNLFLNEIKTSGKITKEAYTDFITRLDKTGYLYDIKLEHQHKVVMPVYSDDNVFLNKYEVFYENSYEDDIIEQVYGADGLYKITFGDYITIQVKSKDITTTASILQYVLGRSLANGKILSISGGMIWNEAY